MSDDALVEAITAALNANPDGLNEREIRQAVLQTTGLRRRPPEIKVALRDNRELFVGPLSGGRWRLKKVIESEELAGGADDAAKRRWERGEPVVPYLAHLPSLDAFVAFDLETTGLNEERDQIIQISAIRIDNGRPATATADDGTELPAVFNEYVRLERQELSYGLKVKLGFVEHPEWEAAMGQAVSLPYVLRRFERWVGGLPLVAHNARFDLGFLQKSAKSIGWRVEDIAAVDTMEIACLARPDLRSYRLEELARQLGVGENEVGGALVERWAAEQEVEAFDWGGFHNAVVDVLVLAAVVPRLVAALRQRLVDHPGLDYLFTLLLPQTAARLNVTAVTPGEPLDEIVKELVQVTPPAVRDTAGVIGAYSPEVVNERFAAMVAANKKMKERPSQTQMVIAVSRALQDERFMLVEAPTGTGKTFAYLVPSVLWAKSQGDPVVITTHTRLLQDQMADDLDRVQARLGLAFQAQVLKGMNNYICLERTAAVFAQTDIGELDTEERFAWFYLLSWLASTRDGLLDELSHWFTMRFPVLAWLRDDLKSDRSECRPQRCAGCRLCFHRQAYAHAAGADIIVMNHALLLSRDDWEEQGFPFTRVIVDEAHNLEDTATEAATDEVSSQSLTYLANRLFDERSGQGVLIRLRSKISDAEGQRIIAAALNQRRLLRTLINDFGQQLKRYVEQNQTQVDAGYGAKLILEANPEKANPVSWRPVRGARVGLSRTLQELGTVVRRLFDWLGENPLPVFQQETRNELYYLADKIAEESILLNSILRVGYDRLVYVHWLEVERVIPFQEGEDKKVYTGPYRWAVKRAPVLVGPFLEQQLYQGKQSVILTSATLRTTRDAGFGFILDRLGLRGRVLPQDAIALAPELDYGRALFAVARYLHADARPHEIQNFTDEVWQELSWFFRFTGGNGLGLFTARERMVRVYNELEPALGQHSIPVGCQGETGSRQALLDELKSRPGSVILGLKSFWEGVDVPGPNLCYIMMEKLPFPMLGEPMIRARAAEVRARQAHEFMDYILPLMLINFKQGFGRLIRSEGDTGAVILLDKRVWNREYRRDLIAALPGMDSDVGEGENSNRPIVLDDETSLSRRAVYEAITEHMAKAPPQWQIDLDRLRAILEEVPEEILPLLEQRLRELALPDIVSPEKLQELWQNVWRAVVELFKFADWRTPKQETAVRALLTGQDALIILPTGSGKSFTFQLPALLRNGTTLVFSPLKALMKDQVDKMLDRNLPVADRVDSTQTAEEQERVYQRMREGTTRLVYIAPERVRDPKLMAALRAARNIVQIVVDEAHCIHMWGQNFRPDFLYISKLVDVITEAKGHRPPVAALTATATPRVRQAIASRLKLREGWAEIDDNPNRPELRFVLYNRNSPGFKIRSKRDKLRVLLRILKTADRNNESAIVYVNTTREAERLANRLEAMALDIRYYHGQMDDQARKDVQDMFLEGQISSIVATKAFGMGVDKPDIRYIVHYQVPGDIESYFQEAGRAGRDGETSWSILLFHKDDLWVHENFFIPKSLPDPDQVAAVLNWLRERYSDSNQGQMFINPRDVTDALEFDEDNQLGIHLHLLEELGAIHRGVDVTLKASTRLLAPAEKVIARAGQVAPGSVSQAFAEVLRKQRIDTLERQECRMVEGALLAGVEPMVLDDLFYQLALEGQLIYRAFARAYTIIPGPNFFDRESLNLEKGEIGRVRQEMEANLAKMRNYAESLRPGDCSREEILNYLGYERPVTRRDECCSLCDVNLEVPWANEPLWEDLMDPARYHDAKYAVLKAVAWNANLAQVRGRGPYGAWKLAQIVVGNDYMATRYEKDSARKKVQRQHIMASEHFGVLEGLRGEADTVLDLMDELQQEGYVGKVERSWVGGSYSYPAPTERGEGRLREGRLFGDG